MSKPLRKKLVGKQLATNLSFPEGPIAMPDGSVALVEIASGNVTRVWGEKIEIICNLPGGPNGMAIGPDGRAYVCNNGGLSWIKGSDGLLRPVGTPAEYCGGSIDIVDLSTGRFEKLYTHCGDIPLRGPNDIVFDRDGGLWFTDLGKVQNRSMDRGAVFYAPSVGAELTQVIFPISLPNGIGISKAEDCIFVSETETARLWKFELGGRGKVISRPWPSPNGGECIYTKEYYGRFDSLAIEACGNICLATLIDSGISVVSPEGTLLEFWEAEDPFCTNICFGGRNMRTAFITLSGFGSLIAVDWPREGLPLFF